MGVTSNRSYFKTLAFLNDLRFNTKSYIVLKLKGLNLRLFPQHIAYVVGFQMIYTCIGNIQNNFHQSSTVTSYYNHTIRRAMFPLHQFQQLKVIGRLIHMGCQNSLIKRSTNLYIRGEVKQFRMLF